MKNILEYILFLSFSFLSRILGLWLSRRFSFIIAVLFYYLIPIRKKVVIENLTAAFPEYSNKQIIKIAFGTYKSFAITLIETLYLPYIKTEDMKNAVKCNNIDLLIKKKQEKKAVILLTAHFGNWEYFAASISLQLNIPLLLITKPQRNTYVTEFMNRNRTRWMNDTISPGISIRQAYKALNDRQFILIAADQRGHLEGLRLNFLGRPSSVYTGPASLAIKTKADVVLSIICRQPDYSYTINFVNLPMNDLPEAEDEKVKEVCKKYINYLEDIIRKHPEQWLWMHKRWKY